MPRWLFIVARNFGDALINRRLIDAVAASFPMAEIDLLTRPSFQEFFEGRQGISAVHTAAFPMGTVKNFSMAAACHLLRVCRRLRGRRYDIAVNSVGDLREALVGWLTRPMVNTAPSWPDDHPARELIHSNGSRYFVQRWMRISERTLNIYAAHDEMARQLGCPSEIVNRLSNEHPERGEFQQNLVGLHPFTTQEWKFWSWQAWIVLTEKLLAKGAKVRVFCSSHELPMVMSHMGAVGTSSGVEFVAGNLKEFLLRLREVAVVVGLDSFAMHAAYSLNVPAVLVNGANDARVWAPPDVCVLSNEGNCPHHPCNSQPTCGDGIVPLYTCIREISPQHVLERVLFMMSKSINHRSH